MAERKKVVLLGATGSIGQNTLRVIEQHAGHFELLGIAANSSRQALDGIGQRFNVPHKTLFTESGLDGLMELATLPDADVVIVATTGTVGVKPTIAALEAGKTVGLANKETLVLAGEFVMPVARSAKGTLLPVDSEHNAIFQCLEGMQDAKHLKRILLTASGGPFLHHTKRELEHVTLADALRHPNWDMGQKVTIDSATMANKGLEMIEAHWLFGADRDQIDVVIHPQSIIHSMVEFMDGSVIAQMAPPSMTYPVQHVLTWPDKLAPTHETMDFTRIHNLELRPPDLEKFPCLRLAGEALAAGGLAPAVYNAANEVAVRAFIEGSISYSGIPELIDTCLQKADFMRPSTLDELMVLEPQLNTFSESQLKTLTP